jgi:hypothetical protein
VLPILFILTEGGWKMSRIHLLGSLVEIEDSTFNILKNIDDSMKTVCNGNACDDIDYRFDEDTRSYHFFNDSNKKINLKVISGSYFGCGPFKTRDMRPMEEWDTGFYGICDYEANYR